MLLNGGLFGHYIKRNNIEELKNYKYTSGGPTHLDKLLNRWWEFVVTLIPTWVAPNSLTLVGFVCAIGSFVLVLLYSPTLTEPAPSWTYFCIAALMFVYQTLDAIDGKHARRTGNSSPLGQLFDHGCDVMAVTFVSLTTLGVTCSGVGLGQYLVVIISTQVHQYIYMWWEYHFRVFFSSTGHIGVTEAQVGMIFICVLSGIFGPQIFAADLLWFLDDTVKANLESLIPFFGHLLLREAMMLWLIGMNMIVAVYDIALGLSRAKNLPLATGQLLSFFAFVFCQWFFYESCLLRDSELVSSVLVYFVMASTYSIIVIRLCLSATCKFPFKPFQWPTIPFYVVVALLSYGPSLGMEFLVVGENKRLVILGLIIWNSIYLLDLLVTSVIDICSQLSINCFVVSRKPIEKLQ